MSTITSDPLPVMRLRVPVPTGAHRRLLAVLVGAVVLVGGAAAVSAGASSTVAAVHLDVAGVALHRATTAGHGADRHGPDADGSALRERASCWRQAHRLGQDPSSCGSMGAADRAR
jgi:hypothetical protein